MGSGYPIFPRVFCQDVILFKILMNVFYVKQTLSYAKIGGVTHIFPDATPPITSAVLTVRCPLRCFCPRRFIKLPAPLHIIRLQ